MTEDDKQFALNLVQEHIDGWPNKEARVFRYRIGFYTPHVLTLRRVGDKFENVEHFSTYKNFDPINIDELKIFLLDKVLMFHETLNENYHFDPVRLRTDNCICGATFTSDKFHLSWCTKRW